MFKLAIQSVSEFSMRYCVEGNINVNVDFLDITND